MAQTWILPFISLLAGALITVTVQHRLASRQRSQQVLERVAEALAATQATLVEVHPDRFLWGTQEVWIDKWSKALDEGRRAERELRVAVLLMGRPVGVSLARTALSSFSMRSTVPSFIVWAPTGSSLEPPMFSRDGRFVLLLTTDPALHGADPVEKYWEYAHLVLHDRQDNSITPISHSGVAIHSAQISDDARILWLSATGDLIDDDVDSTYTKNVFRLDRNSSSLEQVTNGGFDRHNFVIDSNADGSTALIRSNYGVSLSFYDHDTRTATPIPFEFNQWGADGRLDSSGDRVLGIESSFAHRETFVHDRGDSEVELLGISQSYSAADISTNGETLVWIEETELNEKFHPVATTIGIRSPGQPDRFVDVAGDLSAMLLGADRATMAIAYTSPSDYTEIRLATVRIS